MFRQEEVARCQHLFKREVACRAIKLFRVHSPAWLPLKALAKEVPA